MAVEMEIGRRKEGSEGGYLRRKETQTDLDSSSTDPQTKSRVVQASTRPDTPSYLPASCQA
jgi:hypothetical protein